MIVAPRLRTKRLAVSLGACGISALLFSGALSAQQDHEANAARTAAPTQYESKVFANCNMAAFVDSAGRAELMSLCWRRLIQTAALHVAPCFAVLDAILVVDWRAARLLYDCMRGFELEPQLTFSGLQILCPGTLGAAPATLPTALDVCT
jgi:hypothetical protein